MTKPKNTTKNAGAKKRGLGRGLSALMEDVQIDSIIDPDHEQDGPKRAKTLKRDKPKRVAKNPKAKTQTKSKSKVPKSSQQEGVTFVDIACLARNPEQPRRHFDPDQLKELSDSIRKKGILQPILVRPISGQTGHQKQIFQIVAGERRWQAAGMAGLQTLPVFIREITDEEALEIGVIENVQRADLNPMEEALAYKALTAQFQRTQEEVANAVGKSRTYITNMMRLLTLPEKVQEYLAESRLTIGHARAIIAAPDPEQMADIIIEKRLSVRDAEDWVRKIKTNKTKGAAPKNPGKDANIRMLENRLMEATGLSVDLRHKGSHGELRLRYKTLEELDELTRLLAS